METILRIVASENRSSSRAQAVKGLFKELNSPGQRRAFAASMSRFSGPGSRELTTSYNLYLERLGADLDDKKPWNVLRRRTRFSTLPRNLSGLLPMPMPISMSVPWPLSGSLNLPRRLWPILLCPWMMQTSRPPRTALETHVRPALLVAARLFVDLTYSVMRRSICPVGLSGAW